MQFLTHWRQGWRAYFFQWLDKRAPPASRYRLQRDNLYIFPSKAGFACSGLIAVLWLLGTNYQNNLILGLGLLLLSIFVLSILHTHANLAGLEIKMKNAEPGFVGQELAFYLDIENPVRRYKDNIRLAWQDELATVVAIDALEHKTVAVCAYAAQRGYLRPGRLLVETVYPLGLLRCWTWLNIEACTVVYPQPENYQELTPHNVEDERESALSREGASEFAGMRTYRPGDSPRHIAWKPYAQGKGLMSKEYGSTVSSELWLAWDSLVGLDTERRLSTLCFWALHYEQLQCAYGLDIPGVHIEPATGHDHQQRVLTALALFGQVDFDKPLPNQALYGRREPGEGRAGHG